MIESATKTAVKTAANITTHDRKVDLARPVKISENMLSVGQMYPQGDVGLQRLAAVPDGAVLVEKPSAQVAEGTTKGARHIWDSMEGITVYRMPDSDNPLKGDIYCLAKERTLTHPEHADQTYFAGFVGWATFQRTYAEELRRRLD